MYINSIIKNANDALSITERLYLESKDSIKGELKMLMRKIIFVSDSLEEIKEEIRKPVKKRRKIYNKKDVYIIACYLSKFGHEKLFGQYNQSQAFNEISKILNINPNTLKATRDEFDPFFPNNRSGWKINALKPMADEIYNEYKDLNHDEFIKIINEILMNVG